MTYPSGVKEEYTYYNDNLLETLINKKADGSIIDSLVKAWDGKTAYKDAPISIFDGDYLAFDFKDLKNLIRKGAIYYTRNSKGDIIANYGWHGVYSKNFGK